MHLIDHLTNTGNAIWNKQTINLFHHLVFDNSLTEKMEVLSCWSKFDPDSLNTKSKGKNVLDFRKV